MTREERIATIQTMLGEEVNASLLGVYLQQAEQKILNHKYPYRDNRPIEIEPRYEMDLLELAIVLFNQRGAEGQDKHTENGVSRTWRTEQQILQGILPMADTFV